MGKQRPSGQIEPIPRVETLATSQRIDLIFRGSLDSRLIVQGLELLRKKLVEVREPEIDRPRLCVIDTLGVQQFNLKEAQASLQGLFQHLMAHVGRHLIIIGRLESVVSFLPTAAFGSGLRTHLVPTREDAREKATQILTLTSVAPV